MGIHLSFLGPEYVRQFRIQRFGWTDGWSYRGRQYLAYLNPTMESYAEYSRGVMENVERQKGWLITCYFTVYSILSCCLPDIHHRYTKTW